MKKRLSFRAWFYFRMGWSTYFAFVLAAVNTMVVTYYLAIEKVPYLKEIFPTFTFYLATFVLIGIPVLILIGYAHYKLTPAISEEVEITTESNPYFFKIPPGWNTEIVFPLYRLLTEILLKLAKNEKLSDKEIQQVSELQNKIDSLLKGGYVGDYSRKPKSKT